MSKCPRCGLPADYIPPGGEALSVKNVRQIPSGLFARCGASTSYDEQSGPIYCGERAEYMAEVVKLAGGVVKPAGVDLCFVCGPHLKRLTGREVKEAADAGVPGGA